MAHACLMAMMNHQKEKMKRNKMSRTVFVDVDSIDWDLEDLEGYSEFDEQLPTILQSVELTLEDYEENTPTSEMDDGYVEEVLMDSLTKEYGFCINLITWNYVKYRATYNNNKYDVVDMEDGNKVIDTFETYDEAKRFIDNMLNLMNKN